MKQAALLLLFLFRRNLVFALMQHSLLYPFSLCLFSQASAYLSHVYGDKRFFSSSFWVHAAASLAQTCCTNGVKRAGRKGGGDGDKGKGGGGDSRGRLIGPGTENHHLPEFFFPNYASFESLGRRRCRCPVLGHGEAWQSVC